MVVLSGLKTSSLGGSIAHRIHGAIYGNMDPINIPPMLAYIPYMDPMGMIIEDYGQPPLTTAYLEATGGHPEISE